MLCRPLQIQNKVQSVPDLLDHPGLHTMADPYPPTQTASPVPPAQKRKKEPHVYPEAFIVSPTSTHTQTMLLLHGRGSDGKKFGLEFLASKTAAGKSIQELFHGMKFVFPTAKKRRARWYKRAFVNQWFDNVPIDEQSKGMSMEEVDWQLEGLAETAEFLKPLLDVEVMTLSSKNVFIGGLSQGCAMGLHLLLSYEFDKGEESGGYLGGFVGMSGWLPFFDEIQDLIKPGNKNRNDEGNDPFATSDSDEDFDIEPERSRLSAASQVCDFVRQNMEWSVSHTREPPFIRTPVFLGHGKSDEKVMITLGLDVAMVLREMGLKVRWEEYDEGHWYKVPEEIDDIVEFLKTCNL